MIASAVPRFLRSPSVIERRPVFGVWFVPSAPMKDATLATPRSLRTTSATARLQVHHSRERHVGGRLRHGDDEARVFLREKPLRDDDREPTREHERADRDEERDELVVQDHLQPVVVDADHPLEAVFRQLVELAALLGRRLRLEHVRRHHRGERERQERRDDDRRGERDRELAEEATDEAGHEEQRDEHRDERDRERHDREADLLRAFERGGHRVVAVLDVARDVLDHDDRVVDDEACRDRERHERQVIQRITEHVHDAERADERQRHGDGGNNRRAEIPEEREDDEDDEADRDEERELDILDRRAHRLGAVGEDLHLDRLRERRLQLRKQRFDAIGDLNDVRAGLALDVQDDGAAVARPRRELRVLDAVDDVGDVLEADRRAVAVRDDDGLIRLRARELIVGRDRVVLPLAVDVALRLVDVGGDERLAHVLDGEAGAGERGGIDLHADGGLLAAVEGDEADAGDLRDLLGEDGVRGVVDLRQRERRRRHREREYRRVGGVTLTVRRWDRQRRRQEIRGRVDRGLDVLLRCVDVAVERELQRHRRRAEARYARHLRERRHLPELALERRRHRLRHRLRARARQIRGDDDRGVVDLRQRRDGELPKRDDPRQK